jgi:hypothetical protein
MIGIDPTRCPICHEPTQPKARLAYAPNAPVLEIDLLKSGSSPAIGVKPSKFLRYTFGYTPRKYSFNYMILLV